MSRERELIRELRQNEHILQIVGVEELWLEWEQLKGITKTAVNYGAPIMDIHTASRLISEFGVHSDRVMIKQYAGKEYVIFRGNPRSRRILKGTRYLAKNPKVIRMAIGPKGITASAKGGFAITALLSCGIEIFSYLIRDASTLSQLLGTVTSDLIKIGISAITATLAGLSVGTVAIVSSVAAAPLVAAIAVGVATGLMLDRIDSRMGATKGLIQAYGKTGSTLANIKNQAQRSLNHLERNPYMIPCLFSPCYGIRGY